MAMKTFIGYDLGDGESITDLVTLSDTQFGQRTTLRFDAMTMPDSPDAGKALPTVYGYVTFPGSNQRQMVFSNTILALPSVEDIHISFKRCPSDVMPGLSSERKLQIQEMLQKGWPSIQNCRELYNEEMMHFSDSVIAFTNAIFNDEQYQARVRGAANESEEIVFCVGHPTKWSDFDADVYKGILQRSVLGQKTYAGKKASLITAKESRAAYMFTQNQNQYMYIPKGTCNMLLDIGSSTIDVTAMTADSRNHEYNSGHKYLGARSIDLIIRKWFEETMLSDQLAGRTYRSLIEGSAGKSLKESLLLACRKGKEQLYSSNARVASIPFPGLMPLTLMGNDLDRMIDVTAIGPLLAAEGMASPEAVREMGQKNWKQLFREFLIQCKNEMNTKKLKIHQIIMTGSASRMPFVPSIVQEVFQGVKLLPDMDPSRAISMGLALVGPSNERSKAFQAALAEFLDHDLEPLVEKNMPALADAISPIIATEVESIIISNMKQWRNCSISTLDSMKRWIERECSADNLNKQLKNSSAYSNAINKWAKDVVGQDVARNLKELCLRFGANNVSLDYLNVFNVADVHIDGASFTGGMDIVSSLISTIVGIISGIIAWTVLPAVLEIVLFILGGLTFGISSIILTALLSNPFTGIPTLIAIVGGAVVAAITAGRAAAERAKKVAMDILQSAELPQAVRGILTDSKINSELQKANISSRVRSSVLDTAVKKQVASSVAASLRPQIVLRAEDIKYTIESR